MIWQVGAGDFYSVNLHHDRIVLRIKLHITVEKTIEIHVLQFISGFLSFFC